MTPPRDKEGCITHWIDGMSPCNCGENHLFRNCPNDGRNAKQTASFAAMREPGVEARAFTVEELAALYQPRLPPDEIQQQANSSHLETYGHTVT